MASINGTSSTGGTSSYAGLLKGIGGLASGMDTDSLIEGMTLATRTKIAKQKQQKTLLGWKTDAYRSITDQLVSFSKKYTSFASSTNLLSNSFYGRTLITASGENSKYVSASGSANGAQNMTINGIKSLANDASMTTTEALSRNYIETGAINFGEEYSSAIKGEAFTVKIGTKNYNITIPDKEGGGVYENAEELAAAINSVLKEEKLANGNTADTALKVEAEDGKLKFTNTTTDGTSVKITKGSSKLLTALGVTNSDEATTDMDMEISTSGTVAKNAVDAEALRTASTFKERMKDATLTFEYNGVQKTIKFDDESKLNENDFVGFIQDELNSAFGKGRVKVSDNGGKLKFETTVPNGGADRSSILSITSGSAGMLGEKNVFGINAGSANKLNISTNLENSGMRGIEGMDFGEDGEKTIRINGEDITFEYKKGETSIGSILNAINANEKAGVRISYQSNSDSFSIVATQKGASGGVAIGAEDGSLNDFERMLFGKREADGSVDANSNALNGQVIQGKDAVILVDFDGEGGAAPMEVVRGSNTFTLNGMNITINNTFGYEGDNPIAGTEAIKFSAKVDSDKVVNAIKEMVETYNTMVDAIKSTMTEKPERDYKPLTDEQRKEMTESEIENWEKEAKKGMLFGDQDLSRLSTDMRFVFMSTNASGMNFSSIGLSTSSSWSDNGKLTLDETKLRAALDENPEQVANLLNSEMDGNDLTTGGAMTRMKYVLDKYAATEGATKGVLIEKAGNKESPTSMLKNTLLTQMKGIDKTIDTLEDKLKMETKRYQRQFTALEQLVQQMNSQSSWLANQFGG